MEYRVTTFDVCISGFERLRSQSEFIVTASVDSATDADSILTQWLDCLNSCDMGEGFDYGAAESTIREFWRDSILPMFERGPNPFALENTDSELSDDSDDSDGCTAFLFIESKN